MGIFSEALQALGFSKSPSAVANDAAQGVLTPGHFYRVWATVDEKYVTGIYDAAPESFGQTAVQEQLALDLVALGFSHALLVTQDPSDAMVWTFLASWQPTSPGLLTPTANAGPIHFTRFDAVETPQRTSPAVDVPSLDAGLSQDDLYVLHDSLCHDNDPKRLAGLARCFDEDFPLAGALLRNKARLEDLSRRVNLETGPARVEGRENGSFLLSPPAEAVLEAVQESVRDLPGVAEQTEESYADVFQTLAWTPPAEAHAHGQDALFRVEPELAQIPEAERAVAFGKLITLLSRTPSLARVDKVSGLVEKTGLPRSLVAAAVAAAQDLGHGIALFDPEAVRALRPTGPRPVSHGALKMAHAVLRPEGSLAAAPMELSSVLTDLEKSVKEGDPMAIKADEALKRARRLLDRQNWTAWTRRYRAAEAM